jgi:hypothetical protein
MQEQQTELAKGEAGNDAESGGERELSSRISRQEKTEEEGSGGRKPTNQQAKRISTNGAHQTHEPGNRVRREARVICVTIRARFAQ